MAENSKIEWTDATWNPVAGCERVSPGCANCYAVPLVYRMGFNPNAKIQAANVGLVEKQENGKLNWTGEIRTLPDRLAIPLHWKEPRRVFVNSLSDLFHKDVPQEFIYQVSLIMLKAPQHTYQVLTKRPERMSNVWLTSLHCQWLREGLRNDCLTDANIRGMFSHVWLGTSVENQETADERIPHLLRVPAVVRFLSMEPLLGPVNLDEVERVPGIGPDDISEEYNALGPPLYCDGIHWVIVGGESGANARPMHPDWARSLRNQCQAAGVAFHFKQWGEFGPVEKPPYPITQIGWDEVIGLGKIGKKAAGRVLDGREWNEMPEVNA